MRSTAHYVYIKNQASVNTVLIRRRFVKFISLLLVAGGISLLFYVVLPIVQWQLFYAPGLSSGSVLSPIPKAILVQQSGISAVLADATSNIPFGFQSTTASQWFPTGNPKTGITKEYLLSIPKLGIQDAKVIVGADDLTKSLIHYGGASLPGEYGNAVIFGHSVLPQFFNPENYKTIFSTLHTLKTGDTITLVSDDITYRYSITDFRVVDPQEISVLEQNFDNSYVTLITCTPPGTYWKRLVVKAKIDRI